MPKDDNISDVEEQTAFRGGGGGQKNKYPFFDFSKISIGAAGQKFSTFFLPRAVLKTALGSFFI